MRNKHRKKNPEAQAADPQLHAIGARRKVKISNRYWVLEFWARWVLGIGLLGSVGNGYWGFKLAPIPIDWAQFGRWARVGDKVRVRKLFRGSGGLRLGTGLGLCSATLN